MPFHAVLGCCSAAGNTKLGLREGWMGQRMAATVTSYRLVKSLDRKIRKQYSPLAE